MLRRRFEPALLAVGLTGLVLGLDLVWDRLGASTASLAFGLVDEPAHLATAGIAVLALAALAGRRLSMPFVAAALIAGVAIDLDHLPGYLGSDLLAGGTGRPYSHGLLVVALSLVSAFAARGRYRQILLGLSFGVAAHLLRDSATGPGIAPAWPLDDRQISIPYAAYAAALALAAVAVLPRPTALPYRRPELARSRTASFLALAVGALALGAVCPPSTEAGEGKRQRQARVAVGAYVPGVDRDASVLDGYASAVGRTPAIVHLYRTWSEPPFGGRALEPIVARGSIPLVTWEPWASFGGQGISLWEIAAGGRDTYIAEAARQAAAWGGPLFVRFGHEMNGDWYPWGAWVDGNTPGVYKSAWRRIVSIFRAEGAANVRWVWTPYVHIGRLPFKRYYPGDKWVDWAGLDGFNWGNPFISFRKIFEKSYRSMVRLTPKPLMIAETGSVEAGGSKATWIRRAMRRALPRLPRVRALVWFSDVHPRGADWRVDSSPGALRALRRALRAPRYRAGSSFLLRRPWWLRKG